jgi:DNA-binding NarL/FixJ family response regulator
MRRAGSVIVNPFAKEVVFGRTPRPSRHPLKPRQFTKRQEQCLRLYIECGGNVSRIARRLKLDHRTVMQHLIRAQGVEKHNERFNSLPTAEGSNTRP